MLQSSVQSLESSCLVPVRRTVLLCTMVTVVLENKAVHPASHRVPIERRELSVMAGKRCATRADAGRPGMLRSAMWVDRM